GRLQMAGPRRRSAMTNPMIRARANRVFFLAAALSLVPAHLAAQTARAAAAYDYTGYWVSEVTEKWRYRMLVPDKGDYVQVPLNPEGRKVANAWDSAGRQVIAREQRKEADYLKVDTTHMRPGYLQKNGVPYSGSAIVEEYFDTFSDPYTRNTWLAVTTVVTDPQYLVEPLIMHAHF